MVVFPLHRRMGRTAARGPQAFQILRRLTFLITLVMSKPY